MGNVTTCNYTGTDAKFARVKDFNGGNLIYEGSNVTIGGHGICQTFDEGRQEFILGNGNDMVQDFRNISGGVISTAFRNNITVTDYISKGDYKVTGSGKFVSFLAYEPTTIYIYEYDNAKKDYNSNPDIPSLSINGDGVVIVPFFNHKFDGSDAPINYFDNTLFGIITTGDYILERDSRFVQPTYTLFTSETISDLLTSHTTKGVQILKGGEKPTGGLSAFVPVIKVYTGLHYGQFRLRLSNTGNEDSAKSRYESEKFKKVIDNVKVILDIIKTSTAIIKDVTGAIKDIADVAGKFIIPV